MATRKLKFKHIAESATVHVGDTGELILDTTNKTLKISDGSTSGGVQLSDSVTTSEQTIDFGATSSGAATVLTLPTGDSEIILTSRRGSPATSLNVKLPAPNTERQIVTSTYEHLEAGTVAHQVVVLDENGTGLGGALGPTNRPDSIVLIAIRGKFLVLAQHS